MSKAKNIQVAIRLRPLLQPFQDTPVWIANSQTRTVSSIPRDAYSNSSFISSNQDSSFYLKRRPSKVVQKNNVYEFSFDHVFEQSVRNSQVYSQSCEQVINEFLKGKNASIFMYGQTTSGKTYTMLGSQNQKGLIAYSLKDLFSFIKTQEKSSKRKKIIISYLQIYNEQINDLLDRQSSNLKINDNQINGLSQFEVESLEDALQLLQEGEKLRAYSEKDFHEHSSRSHTIFRIKIIQQQLNGQLKKNVLNLIDLAGSERIGEESSNEETGYINKSLFVLSNVIHKLSQKKNVHVPFRDSKLTRVLASSLTTNSQTVFICTISPAEMNFIQTLSTLRFANQSRKVELKSIQQSSILNESCLQSQQNQIKKLREENNNLRKSFSYKKTIKNDEKQLDCNQIQIVKKKIENYVQKNEKQNKKCLGNYLNQYCFGKVKAQQTISQTTNAKLQNLYQQYQRNVKTLERQYIKAMINLASEDLKMPIQHVKKQILPESLTL